MVTGVEVEDLYRPIFACSNKKIGFMVTSYRINSQCMNLIKKYFCEQHIFLCITKLINSQITSTITHIKKFVFWVIGQRRHSFHVNCKISRIFNIREKNNMNISMI